MNRLFAASLVVIFSSSAHAATRSYSFSEPENRVGTCLVDGTQCGKIVADAFCKGKGYSESILFAREKVAFARILDSDAKCEGDHCEAFKRIKCYQPIGETATQSNQPAG